MLSDLEMDYPIRLLCQRPKEGSTLMVKKTTMMVSAPGNAAIWSHNLYVTLIRYGKKTGKGTEI